MIYFTPLLDLTGRYDKLVGDNFRIYSDTVSGNVVNLDLVKVKFTVTNETIQLEIPIEFWELIRTKSFVNFDIAEKTDKEIEKAVRETVVDRIKHQDRSENPVGTV